eukprot:COSAG01_NODE_8523_length_2753_cov_37.942847_1_plen_157_part_00
MMDICRFLSSERGPALAPIYDDENRGCIESHLASFYKNCRHRLPLRRHRLQARLRRGGGERAAGATASAADGGCLIHSGLGTPLIISYHVGESLSLIWFLSWKYYLELPPGFARAWCSGVRRRGRPPRWPWPGPCWAQRSTRTPPSSGPWCVQEFP